ncbi:MAG: type II secretion system protein [Microthrixaceae bacterium]
MAGEPHKTACVRRSRARTQSGATLIEIIVVMAVAIPVILAAAVGLLTTVRLSSATEQQQQAEAQATAFAESVKQIPYVPCAVTADYETSPELWAPPTGVTVQILDVGYWSQADRDYTSTSCASAADDLGAQLVTVRAVTSERSATLEVVKRDPNASAEVATP